jgi:hypothetical protein
LPNWQPMVPAATHLAGASYGPNCVQLWVDTGSTLQVMVRVSGHGGSELAEFASRWARVFQEPAAKEWHAASRAWSEQLLRV